MCKILWGKENQIKNLGFKNAENEFYIFSSNPRRNKANIKFVNHYKRLATICLNQFSLFTNNHLISASDSFYVIAVGRLLRSSESLMCIFFWTIFYFLESTVISCLCLYFFMVQRFSFQVILLSHLFKKLTWLLALIFRLKLDTKCFVLPFFF